MTKCGFWPRKLPINGRLNYNSHRLLGQVHILRSSWPVYGYTFLHIVLSRTRPISKITGHKMSAKQLQRDDAVEILHTTEWRR